MDTPTYSIIRSKRKTISLIITPEAKLEVRAPLRTSEAYIGKLVDEKRGWIDRKITEMAGRPAPAKKQFVDGEEFLYLGKKYRMRIVDGRRPGIGPGEDLCVSGRTADTSAPRRASRRTQRDRQDANSIRHD